MFFYFIRKTPSRPYHHTSHLFKQNRACLWLQHVQFRTTDAPDTTLSPQSSAHPSHNDPQSSAGVWGLVTTNSRAMHSKGERAITHTCVDPLLHAFTHHRTHANFSIQRIPTRHRFTLLMFGVRFWGRHKWGWRNCKKRASKISILKFSAMCGNPRIFGRLLVGMSKRSRLTAVQDGRSASATQACTPRRKKDTLRASMRTHYVSGLRAPKAFKNGALRHRLLHAGRSDRSEVFLPGQSLPRNEPYQKKNCCKTFSHFHSTCRRTAQESDDSCHPGTHKFLFHPTTQLPHHPPILSLEASPAPFSTQASASSWCSRKMCTAKSSSFLLKLAALLHHSCSCLQVQGLPPE